MAGTEGSTTRRSGGATGEIAVQRRLAERLVRAVGHDGAIRYCRGNAWEGVRRTIETHCRPAS
ncbi:MAG: hypothetical protein HKM95_18465 [Inquilinus sp.]|nr:hypothetical protein [Inquilinus sp.]